jgi:hypothetical protein
MRWESALATGETGNFPDENPKLTMVMRIPIARRLRGCVLSLLKVAARELVALRKIAVSLVITKGTFILSVFVF